MLDMLLSMMMSGSSPELKRVSSGTVELKFTDRMRALETLYKLLEQEREGGRLEAFYEDLDGGGDK